MAFKVFDSNSIVKLKYTNTAGTSITASTTTVPFANLVTDTHNAYNGTVFTAPIPGLYRITGSIFSQLVTLGTSSVFQLHVKVTSTPESLSAQIVLIHAIYGNGVSNRQHAQGTRVFRLAAGDTLELQANSDNTVSLDTTATRQHNHIAIERIGD